MREMTTQPPQGLWESCNHTTTNEPDLLDRMGQEGDSGQETWTSPQSPHPRTPVPSLRPAENLQESLRTLEHVLTPILCPEREFSPDRTRTSTDDLRGFLSFLKQCGENCVSEFTTPSEERPLLSSEGTGTCDPGVKGHAPRAGGR